MIVLFKEKISTSLINMTPKPELTNPMDFVQISDGSFK